MASFINVTHFDPLYNFGKTQINPFIKERETIAKWTRLKKIWKSILITNVMMEICLRKANKIYKCFPDDTNEVNECTRIIS